MTNKDLCIPIDRGLRNLYWSLDWSDLSLIQNVYALFTFEHFSYHYYIIFFFKKNVFNFVLLFTAFPHDLGHICEQKKTESSEWTFPISFTHIKPSLQKDLGKKIIEDIIVVLIRVNILWAL